MDTIDLVNGYAKLVSHSLGYTSGQIELTSKCFQRCRFCESWRDHKSGEQRGEIPLAVLKALMIQLAETEPCIFRHLSLTGGDPQAWPWLDQFFRWYLNTPSVHRIKLQVSTALTQDVEDLQLWREAIYDLRVSLDAITPDGYAKARGVKFFPEDILQRIVTLDIPRAATLTVLTKDNLREVDDIINALSAVPLRKATFLPVIGERAKNGSDDEFWDMYDAMAAKYSGWNGKSITPVPTSFSEHMGQTRRWTRRESTRKVGCWTCTTSFHIKANGDIYPCCVVGGEAVETQRDWRLGNLYELMAKGLTLESRRPGSCPDPAYKYPPCYYDIIDVCKDSCQFKQALLNKTADEFSRETLALL